MTVHANLIDGEWVEGEAVPNVNPANTGEVVGHYARASAEDAGRAIAAAKAAFPGWSRSGPLERHGVLSKAAAEILARKEELGRLLSREEGKTLAEGIGETVRAAQIFDFFAGECLRLTGEILPSVRPGLGVEITREAVGPVGLITPWNFPIAIPAWKLAPALAWGNTAQEEQSSMMPTSGEDEVMQIQEVLIILGKENIALTDGIREMLGVRDPRVPDCRWEQHDVAHPV